MQSSSDKELRILLTKIMDVCDFLYQRYTAAKEGYVMDENDNKLNRKEENGNIYLIKII
jgi:hypothetical protein